MHHGCWKLLRAAWSGSIPALCQYHHDAGFDSGESISCEDLSDVWMQHDRILPDGCCIGNYCDLCGKKCLSAKSLCKPTFSCATMAHIFLTPLSVSPHKKRQCPCKCRYIPMYHRTAPPLSSEACCQTPQSLCRCRWGHIPFRLRLSLPQADL